MRRAIAEAARARGRTRPNPWVGCVLVHDKKIIAVGRTQKAGGAHAEVDALRRAGERARGATAYVTLEPCNHVGRTGRCTDALIAAGVSRVVFGARDPNPRVTGGGAARLRRAGIAVEGGVLDEEIRAQLAPWLRWIASSRPRVTLKAAITLDGRLAAAGGDARWVSGPESRRVAHQLRAENDAILVGARTVALDDPELTTRLVRGPDPLRVILDGKLSISPRARAAPGALIATVADVRQDPVHAKKASALRKRGAEILALPGKKGRVDLRALLDELGRREIQSLLVEGGGEVHGQLLRAGLVDEVVLFIAPKLIGAGGVPLLADAGPRRMADAWRLERVTVARLGDDLVVRGFPAAPAKRR